MNGKRSVTQLLNYFLIAMTLEQTLALPQVDGVTFRPFRGAADYQPITDLKNHFNAAYDVEEVLSVAELANEYEHPDPGQDLSRDLLLAEHAGQLVGLVGVDHNVQVDGDRIVWQDLVVLPKWQSHLEPALLQFGEQRARQIAIEQPVTAPHYLSVWRPEADTASVALVLAKGYAPSRHYFDMKRDLTKELPSVVVPAGLDIRTFEPNEANYRAVYVGNREAFRDHYGYHEWTEADYQSWRNDPTHDVTLWRIAWDATTTEVAGVAINTIFEADNETYGFRRGWVNNLSVRRPWRGRGLAKALLAHSFIALRQCSMTEAMLGVDAQNLTGALHLYQSVGFEIYKRNTVYRKQFAVNQGES